MVDWTSSMEQTYEYYEVDPITWKDKKKLDNITSSSINRDLDTDTLESASIEAIDMFGETYVRIYLVTIQNEATERTPLGTFLLQTPSSSFDGKVNHISIDAYSPLMELKENPLPLGYSLLKDENIMHNAYLITNEHCRCPVIETTSTKTLSGDFVSNTDDTYLVFLRDLLKQDNKEFGLDELSRIIFKPIQDYEKLQPVYTFDDSNSSILLPEITLKHDLYKIPNVVEIICSSGTVLHSVVKNEDPGSPTSIQNRGREIKHLVTNLNLPGFPTQEQLDEYAENLLKQLSSIEYTITFSHGYCPVRIGDCVRLNYEKAGLKDVKAKIINQSIKCKGGCQVNATAIFTKKLWK